MAEKPKKQMRVDLRKNRGKPPRGNDVTRQFKQDREKSSEAASGERVRAKGDISRKRTISVDAEGDKLAGKDTIPGRVLRVYGLFSDVECHDGTIMRCTLRRLLKTLATDERSVLTTGDKVHVSPSTTAGEGVIDRIDPRHGILSRSSRKREHVLVSNVDQLVIVVSLVQPDLKPHLIDRYIAAAYQGSLKPIVVLNKADLADVVELQPLVGAYSQLGIPAVLTSAKTGYGLDRLRRLLQGRASVFSGQSGVGKSSLLNAVQPGLELRVRTVSDVNQKGMHTTTTTQLIRLEGGGWLVDTPGIRQFQPQAERKEESEGFFLEFRPYVHLCSFPDCTHTHETRCAIQDAVRKKLIADRRYDSYVGLYHGTNE